MKRFSTLPLILLALCCCPVSAQDIILLNQDGEKVGVAKDIEAKKINDREAEKPATDNGSKNGSATLENGVITIVGPDGKVEQIELSDARSFTVTRSSKTVVDENGNRQREAVNKAILIGPDGVRREINLGDGDSNKGSATKTKKEKTWMIGASCEPVTPVLRAQLRLDETMGLVVTRVLRGSSAAEAGLQVNDILMYADQKPVGKRKQLSEFVNAAGSAGKSISFIFLRGGEEMTIKVKPTEREDVEGIGDIGIKLEGMGLHGFGDNMDFEFKQFGPGVIIGRGGFGEAGGFEERHRKMIEEHQKRLEEFQKKMDEMHRKMNGDR